MEIRCRCSGCQAKFKVDAKYAEKKARCPKCQQIVDVPLENLEGSTVTSFPALGGAQPSGQGPGISNSTFIPPKTAAAKPTTAAAPLPAQSPAAPGGPSGGFANLNLGPARSAPAASAARSATQTPHKKSNLLPLVIAGGVAAVVFIGIGVVAVIAMSQPAGGGKKTGKGSNVARAATADGTLIIDWSDDDRRGGGLSINGRKEPIPASGEIKFTLPPGQHRIFLQRRGFEPIDASVSLTKGEMERFAPQWKTAAVAAATPPIGPATAVANVTPAPSNTMFPNPGGTGFPIGTALASLAPAGFEGWLQNLDQAGAKAAAEKKEVLMVFGCSDVSPATRAMVEVLQRPDVKSLIQSRFIPVVIDFPRTRSASELVQDSAHNELLQERFTIRQIPVLVLLDEKTRPYFIQRDWEDGFDGLQALIDKGQLQRAERDRVLAAVESAAEADRLTKAEEAEVWLSDHQLILHYAAEQRSWLALARRVDPDNAAGRLEKFLVPELIIRVVEAGQQENSAAVLAALQDLEPWFTKRFVNPDLGARVHMMAAQILLAGEQETLAERHMRQATSYQPADKELRESLAGLRLALQNKDVLGSGSGYLVSSAGYVLTNHHVIEGEGRIEIRVPGTKDTVPAKLIAQDPDRDIALLKVALPDAAKYQPIALATEPVRRGAAVAAFGFPKGDALGAGLKFTSGTISALPDEANDQMYLLDVTINPGNSGGPLCDRRGNVVGMITAKTTNQEFEDSYGLAVPAADLLQFLGQHLPATAPRLEPDPAAANLDWDQVDEKVSSGVLMILKKK